jgi:tRNA dimethylallyltransferase
MIENGLIEETKAIMEKYQNYNSNAFQGLGYKYIISYLQGRITKDEAIEKTKKDIRNFAKRQLSWFKNQLKVDYWINIDQYQSINKCVEEIIGLMKEEGY